MLRVVVLFPSTVGTESTGVEASTRLIRWLSREVFIFGFLPATVYDPCLKLGVGGLR